MRRILFALLITLSLSLLLSSVRAQDGSPDDLRTVYVTTQKNASLRAGPGTNWERLAVIPYSTTLRATGRTLNADWLQVAYSGQLESQAYPEATIDGVTYGWIASRLLFWTGSVLELTVDGVHTVNFARATGGLILLTPDEPIYIGLVGPTERVPYPLDGTAWVEATGRLGRGENYQYWAQVKANGQFYWVSTVGIPSSSLPDASYLYSVGRLNIAMTRNLSRLNNALSDINYRWYTLSMGQAITCNDIPADFRVFTFSDTDIGREPVYAALNRAFTSAQVVTNRAIDRFREVCANAATPVTEDEIQAARADVDEGLRLLRMIQLLRDPLENLDPYNE